MPKRKIDPSRAGLGSSEVEGQGTTQTETGSFEKNSSRKSKKQVAKGSS
jgi:hypothetical protein